MAFAVADRVKESTTSTGTGTINLGGTSDGFQTFVAGIGDGNTTYYAIAHQTAAEWEVGIGTVTDAATDTLSRDTIISSSNGGSAVNFSAGSKDVIATLPSSKSYVLDNAGDTTISADLSVTSISGSGAGLTTLNASNVSSGTLDNARLSAIPNSALENSAITINGTSTDLGGSINVGDITGVTAGTGISGGGTTGDVSVALDLNELTTSTSDADGDFFAVVDSVGNQKKLTKANINLSGFNNDLPGDIEGVTAGNGLTGGGTTGTVTLNVGAGTGIDVTADAVAVDVSDFMSNGSNNRVLTATGTDAMNAEANMTFDGSTLAVTGGATLSGDLTVDTTTLHVDSTNNRVGIGTSSPTNKLTVSGGVVEIRDGNYIMMRPSGNTWDMRLEAVSQRLDVVSGGATGSPIATFVHGGNVGIGTSSPTTTLEVNGVITETSSINYKENVKPLEFNDAIYNVNAVKYDRKDGSSKDEVGVIAEELYKVLPDLVTTKDGKPEAVKYTKMTMYLLEALKKQNQEIQLLKEKLNG